MNLTSFIALTLPSSVPSRGKGIEVKRKSCRQFESHGLIRNLAGPGLFLFLALLLLGCETAQRYSLTYKLWDKGTRPVNRPATEPRLEMFAAETPPDVLVTYDAVSERKDRLERFAYFVFTNGTRVTAGKAPRLVDSSLSENMTPVLLFAETNAVPNSAISARYPVKTDNGTGFELFRNGQSEGTYSLPVYREEAPGPATQVALTPLAIVGDTMMVAGVVATFGAVIWIQAGCPPFTGTH
jgi:hypothetical protein